MGVWLRELIQGSKDMCDNFIFSKKRFLFVIFKTKTINGIIVVKFTNKMRFCLTKKKPVGGQGGGLL